MARESNRFLGDTFLQAAIAEEGENMVVEDGVGSRVKASGGTFAREREAHGISDALTERAGGGFYAGSFVELRVARGDRVELAEIFHFLARNSVTREVEPSVKKHRAVTCREEKTVAIQPAWSAGLIAENFAEKHGTNLCATEWKPQVTGGAGVNGIHGKTTGLIGGGRKYVGIHKRETKTRDGRKKSQLDKWRFCQRAVV
jgi:hypothetical protein